MQPLIARCPSIFPFLRRERGGVQRGVTLALKGVLEREKNSEVRGGSSSRNTATRARAQFAVAVPRFGSLNQSFGSFVGSGPNRPRGGGPAPALFRLIRDGTTIFCRASEYREFTRPNRLLPEEESRGISLYKIER